MARRDPTLVIRRADTFLARLTGLLLSPPPAPGEALLITPCAAVHTAFMRYPIDVVFLDRAGVIRKTVPHLLPWRIAACRGAHQVLELAAGEVRHADLREGRQVRLVPPVFLRSRENTP